MSAGALIFDHYEKYFGKPSNNVSSHDKFVNYPVQVLRFDGVFADCVTYATLGASHFRDQLGGALEIVLVSDLDHADISVILASVILYSVENGINLLQGAALGNLASFADRRTFSQRAIYIADCIPLPPSFRCLKGEGQHITFKLAFFIHNNELEHVRSNGRESFETLLEKNSVDPFTFQRPSVV